MLKTMDRQSNQILTEFARRCEEDGVIDVSILAICPEWNSEDEAKVRIQRLVDAEVISWAGIFELLIEGK